MPIIKSAKKRVRVSAKATVRNAKTKRTLREAVKSFYTTLEGNKTDKINQAQAKANRAIDIAVKKNVIHKNKAARKKSQLSDAVIANNSKTAKKPTSVKDAKIKTTPVKKTVKKVATKKATIKKSVKK